MNDEDDDSAALAHQMELEQQEQEEEALARGRRLLTENRRRVDEFEHECATHCAHVIELTNFWSY